MGAPEVEAFLTHLAVEGNVAAATQNQALSALLFLYREVLGLDLPWLDNVTRAKRPQRMPVVLTREETRAVLDRMSGVYGLMARLLYDTGMRLMECVRLRVKEVDFARRALFDDDRLAVYFPIGQFCSPGRSASFRQSRLHSNGDYNRYY